ncbi:MULTISPECIES: aminodeoxychorismate lyase [Halomonadaceae]|uniref:Aminodeoxychorismate lyase n=1 Tax=Vreelandella titanicae TaxID=664683 RepID=A0AAP9NJG8_9GAMM|nr:MULTISPECIES: aminodeoxychorismate lyase [Halomonas]QKS23083.1 Aminodeoxychorismate lyase [Halomonas titanicae]CDG55728.1 Aminodeoxychorismate lyase [Halomonas sp. A3H3]SDI23655.1 4-amino-4-deoxychorismate lyase [Halomonas titanicae]
MLPPTLCDDQSVQFDDRGLAYGDGLFETVLLRAGKPMLWRYHKERLAQGCHRLGLPLPCQEALDATWQGDPTAEFEVLKLILTRGSGGRGYAQPDQITPRLLSRRTPFQPSVKRWQEGVTVRLCDLRLARQPRLAGIKHLNRLENVLARQEWVDATIAEGLLADSEGLVVEATSMNVFWQQAGEVLTPLLDQCGVAGTLRAALLDQGAAAQASLTLHQLVDVERLWVANSVQGVWPVTTLLAADGSLLQRWPLSQPDPFQRLAHQLLGVV